MSSTSPSLCSPSSKGSSFALTRFERRSLFSSFSLENFRASIISTKYDCTCWINSQSKVLVHGRVRSELTRNSAKPSRASLIFWVGHHSKSHFGEISLIKSPVLTISTERLKLSLCPGDTSSSSQFIRGDHHKSHLRKPIKVSSWVGNIGLTAIVSSRASSITISCLPSHRPSYNEVMALTDSSKASLLFFYEPSIIWHIE